MSYFSNTLSQGLMAFIFLFSLSIAKPASASPLAVTEFSSFADLIEKVSPSVVSVSVEGKVKRQAQMNLDQIPEPFREFFNFPNMPQRKMPERRTHSEGSGFFISSDGYVVTNNHVIDGGDKILITTQDEKEYEVEVIGVDALTDLALLKVKDKKKDFDYVSFDETPNLRVGDWVVAVGNPYSLNGTATAGIISATKRNTGTKSTNYYDFIQIDAPINRGNSGGPTFNLKGKVIGVNAQIYSPSGGNVGIGFAIPSDVASQVIKKLKEKGQIVRGWLGVAISRIDQDIADSIGLTSKEGAIIQGVVEDSPAEKSGLKAGDVILRIDGTKVKNATFATRQIGALSAGEKVRFEINRLGKEKTMIITLDRRPDEKTLNVNYRGKPSQESSSESLTGVSVRPLLQNEERRYSKKGQIEGVVIEKIEEGSPAAEKRLSPGLLISQVNQKKIKTPEDFIKAIEQANKKGKKAVLIFMYNQRGQRISIGLPLKKKKDLKALK